ncbi:hypothetical protein [Staphylococcus cohnii]|uniref:hypothetical protein n=1 Tax=Staphylococcus cohnii TaxID=29382 RepID=UPI003D7D3F45
MGTILYNFLDKIEVNESIVLEEESDLFIERSSDLKERYELMEKETAFKVFNGNQEVGTLTKWNDGTVDYFSYDDNKDQQLEYVEDLVKFLK